MIARIEKVGKRWTGYIEDNGQILYTLTKIEYRPGCALRSLLNSWQAAQGNPDGDSFELNIDDW